MIFATFSVKFFIKYNHFFRNLESAIVLRDTIVIFANLFTIFTRRVSDYQIDIFHKKKKIDLC